MINPAYYPPPDAAIYCPPDSDEWDTVLNPVPEIASVPKDNTTKALVEAVRKLLACCNNRPLRADHEWIVSGSRFVELVAAYGAHIATKAGEQ